MCVLQNAVSVTGLVKWMAMIKKAVIKNESGNCGTLTIQDMKVKETYTEGKMIWLEFVTHWDERVSVGVSKHYNERVYNAFQVFLRELNK